MKIEPQVDTAQHTTSLRLTGELDVHQAKVLKAAAFELFRDEPWTYVVDLAGITYLDSSGLGMLVYLQKEIGRRAGRLKIINVQDSVFKVFDLTKLTTFFDLSQAATAADSRGGTA